MARRPDHYTVGSDDARRFSPLLPGKPVEYVVHATHVDNAVDMIVDVRKEGDAFRFLVNLKASPAWRDHNDHIEIGMPLLFFGCELGSAWKDKKGIIQNRYGNIAFKFLLEDVFQAFKDALGADISFYAMGTDSYKQEKAHKVLVASSNEDWLILGNFPHLDELNTVKPLNHVKNLGWLQMDSEYLDQMEFVFLFNEAVTNLKVWGEMLFVSHQTICVPLPRHCEVSCTVISDGCGRDRNCYDNNERANEKEAKSEFAAAVLIKRSPCLLEYIENSGALDELKKRMQSDLRPGTNSHFTKQIKDQPDTFF